MSDYISHARAHARNVGRRARLRGQLRELRESLAHVAALGRSLDREAHRARNALLELQVALGTIAREPHQED